MVDPDSHEPNTATLAILSGSDVMLWDLSFPIRDHDKPNQNPIQEEPPKIRVFDPYPQYDDGVPISSLAWNHNQMVVATSSGISTDDFAHDNIVLLSSQTGQTLDSFQHDLEWKQKQQYAKEEQFQNIPWSAVNSVNFGGKSRYLCVGDEGGAVCLWDLKKKIRVRHFFHTRIDHSGSSSVHPSPSNQVSLDPTDTYVLSLSPLVLYQYNLRDGQLVGTLQLPRSDDMNVSHFTLFSISDLEPNLCALGTDDGSIYIHDITSHSASQSQPLFKMPQTHSGEVTGLAFSPANPDILFSCGNDGVILLHNKAERRSYRIRGALDRIDSSIESMSLHANGVTCAIGCKSGDVVVCNIQNSRNGEERSATLLASFQSSEPIQSLSFAPPPRAKHKQRQLDSNSNNENSAPKESTPSAGATSVKTSATAAKPKPMSPTAGSPNLAQRATRTRAASPFAKKLSELSSTPKSPKKQQKTERPPLTNLRLTPSPGRKTNSTENNQPQTEQIRDVVREEVENLQDEMEEQLRNIHTDMINQFHQQSQEIESVISKHFAAIERLTLENQQLREENERLRMGQRG